MSAQGMVSNGGEQTEKSFQWYAVESQQRKKVMDRRVGASESPACEQLTDSELAVEGEAFKQW